MKKLLLLLILFVVSPRIGMNIEANNAIASICNVIKKGVRYLFIGDSITDGGWGRSGGKMMPTEERNLKDLNHIYGHSYMMLCAARIQSDYPEQETQFFNRGISGNTLHDLQGRWQADCLDLNPDVVTLLIGTNDVDQYLSGKAPLDMKKWESDYRQLLDQLREVNPNVKIPPSATVMSRLRINPNIRKMITISSVPAAIPVTGIRILESTVPIINDIPAPSRIPNPRQTAFRRTTHKPIGKTETTASFAITIWPAEKGIGKSSSMSSDVYSNVTASLTASTKLRIRSIIISACVTPLREKKRAASG